MWWLKILEKFICHLVYKTLNVEGLEQRQIELDAKAKEAANRVKQIDADYRKALAKSAVTLERMKQKEIEAKNQFERQQQSIKLQKEDPALFLTQLHHGDYLWMTQDELHKKFIDLTERIETSLNVKFSLKPLGSYCSEENSIVDSNQELMDIEELKDYHKFLNFKDITLIIEAKKTGLKSKKEYFYNSKNTKCSTEDIVKEFYSAKGYNVLYTENSFWKPLIILAYAEEIWSQDWSGFDYSPDNIYESTMYQNNSVIFEKKTEFLKTCDLAEFIKQQIFYFGFLNFNVFSCMGTSYIEYIIKYGMEFLEKIPREYFIKIASNSIKYLAKWGNGFPDLAVWNDNEFFFVEVKRQREKIREAQERQIVFFRQNNIPIKIVRVKGI